MSGININSAVGGHLPQPPGIQDFSLLIGREAVMLFKQYAPLARRYEELCQLEVTPSNQRESALPRPVFGTSSLITSSTPSSWSAVIQQQAHSTPQGSLPEITSNNHLNLRASTIVRRQTIEEFTKRENEDIPL
ncbi:unnamed protein product [Protopolystoma xenopodis]|uniref:Uncharacterized protein n=1 Tax=Protopolystoma xenopodis TaxID=117903 RepID=A0A3S5BRF2_9PLAT|nr:unnamed protein product [Protopolystoma xenopodis]